jgi:hypothetical protein
LIWSLAERGKQISSCKNLIIGKKERYRGERQRWERDEKQETHKRTSSNVRIFHFPPFFPKFACESPQSDPGFLLEWSCWSRQNFSRKIDF